MTTLVAKVLRDKIPEVINLWEERVLKEVEAARLQRKPALRNSMEGFLRQLAEELEDGHRTTQEISSGKSRSQHMGREHGKFRAESINYTIDQLIFEYHILRQTLYQVLGQEESAGPRTLEIIVDYIEEAVNFAATQFSKTLSDIQDRLSRTLAHDLRSPMTVAKASAELILRRPEDKKNCIDKASRIVGSMDRIDRMIRDLLDSTKLKAGEKPHVNFTECDLDWIIREVAYEANLLTPEKVVVHSDQSAVGFWNEAGLQRIVENLVNNGIKYGDPGSPVTVSLTEDGRFVTIKVHNCGDPIQEKDIPKLFETFHREESAKEKEGWGLGLSVVKTLVEAHDGKISVESSREKGTTFSVTLPMDSRQIEENLLN